MKNELLTDRIAGIVLFIFAAWYSWHASTLKSPFLADTLGPGTFPLSLGILLGVLSLFLIFKPEKNPKWPTNPAVWLKMGLILVSFVVYAYLIEPLGFILSTGLEMSVLAYLFNGPILKGVVASFIFATFVFLLFDTGLSLSLPTGSVLERLGG